MSFARTGFTPLYPIYRDSAEPAYTLLGPHQTSLVTIYVACNHDDVCTELGKASYFFLPDEAKVQTSY